MLFGQSKKLRMPTPDEALPGRSERIPVPEKHFVLGTPLDAEFEGKQTALFALGCGRVFEGDAAMMHASLMKLAALPADTKIWCGHEYTASNLKFAAAVEPDNKAVTARAESLSKPSVPALMKDEHATNPFLRAAEPSVIAAAAARGAQKDPVSVFAAIREWKNSF